MKTFIVIVLLVFCCVQDTPAAVDEQFQVKPEQPNYERYYWAANESGKWLSEFRDFTELLIRHCKLEELRSQGFVRARFLPKNTTLVFEVPADTLARYESLSWEAQHIYFPNIITRISGYGLVSRVEILRLRVENMKLTDAPEDTIRSLEVKYLKACKDLDDFLATQM